MHPIDKGGGRCLESFRQVTPFGTNSNVGAAVVRDMRQEGTGGMSLGGQGTYELVTGALFQVPKVSLGFACKRKRAGKKRYTLHHLHFLRWCYSQGVQDKAMKFTAESAEKVMRLHGTVSAQAS